MNAMKCIINIVAALLITTTSVFATGICTITEYNDFYFNIEVTKTLVNIKDQISITTVTQKFTNQFIFGDTILYGFPLNENASPLSLRYFHDGEWNEADVNSLLFKDITLPQNSDSGEPNPNLAEYLGENAILFSSQLDLDYNDTITIEFTYVELLPYYNGKVQYFQKNNKSELFLLYSLESTFDLILETDKEIINLQLDNLAYTVEELENGYHLSHTKESQEDVEDYHLEYEFNSDALGIISFSTLMPDSLFNCDNLGDGHLTILIEPEPIVDTDSIKKNFTLIIDRSNSMLGNKMLQARNAAKFIIENLNQGDYFNVIDFGSDVNTFSNTLVEYNTENKDEALQYIQDILTDGSTNISDPLLTAISQFNIAEEDNANIILFFTDGNPTAGETNTTELLNVIDNEVNSTGKEVFIFSMGIGNEIDPELLTMLSQRNNGDAIFINPSDLAEELINFFTNIKNPLIINTDITFTPDIIDHIYPTRYQNFYQGQQLVLHGRYQQSDELHINISGQVYNTPVNYEYNITLADSINSNFTFLPLLWAKQKLQEITVNLNIAETEAQQDSIANIIESIYTCVDSTTTGTNDIIVELSKNEINTYPNPIINYVAIDIFTESNISQKVKLRLYSATGQLVKQQITNMQNGKVIMNDLQSITNGIYFLNIEIDNKQYLAKLVK